MSTPKTIIKKAIEAKLALPGKWGEESYMEALDNHLTLWFQTSPGYMYKLINGGVPAAARPLAP